MKRKIEEQLASESDDQFEEVQEALIQDKENAEAEKQRVEVIHPDEMTQDIMDHLRDGGVEGLLENL